MQATNHAQRRPTDTAVTGIRPESRVGDRLLQLPEVSAVTTLSEATHRWLRHRGEGPPLFKLGRRLVCYESDVHVWIAEQAAKDIARSA